MKIAHWDDSYPLLYPQEHESLASVYPTLMEPQKAVFPMIGQNLLARRQVKPKLELFAVEPYLR